MKKMDLHELTIKLDTWFYDELEDYLTSLNGIIDAKVNRNESTIYVKYDSSIMNVNWIKLEILVFQECKSPSILEFDKHSKNTNSKYEFILKGYCCGTCFKSDIEHLLSIEGIEKVYSNYSDDPMKSVKISIDYDKNLITKADLQNIYNIFTDEIFVFEDQLNWNLKIETAKYSSKKEDITNQEVISFHFSTVNERGKHINIFIKTNLPIQKLENLDLNDKISITDFITDFLIFFEEKLITNHIHYDSENIILEKKDHNLYTIFINFKIIHFISKKEFKLK